MGHKNIRYSRSQRTQGSETHRLGEQPLCGESRRSGCTNRPEFRLVQSPRCRQSNLRYAENPSVAQYSLTHSNRPWQRCRGLWQVKLVRCFFNNRRVAFFNAVQKAPCDQKTYGCTRLQHAIPFPLRTIHGHDNAKIPPEDG